MIHISANSLPRRSPLLTLTPCAWLFSGILTLFSYSSSNIYLGFWLLLLVIIPPSVCTSCILISWTATVLHNDGTSQLGIPLKTPSRLPFLLGTDGLPLGWPTSLSSILEKFIGPSVCILSSKHLPPLYLNNTNSFLGNYLSLLYLPWFPPYIVDNYC